MRGFEQAASLVAPRIQAVGERRGFAVARLLTHWPEIVGPEIAAQARPVRISHGKGFGATLTLLVAGPQAPLVAMRLEQIRERVNACYGFNAVARVTLTQTAASGFGPTRGPSGAGAHHAPAGFAEPPPGFAGPGARPPPGAISAPISNADPALRAQADALAQRFSDPELAAAIRRMALNILSRRDANDRKATP